MLAVSYNNRHSLLWDTCPPAFLHNAARSSQRCSQVSKNISKDKGQEKTTLEKTLTDLPDSPYICADEDHFLKLYVMPDTMLPTGRWHRDGREKWQREE